MEMIGIAVCCWALADFASGVGHWFEDRYAREEWRVIGPLIATPNREHHDDPRGMSPHYLDRNAVTIGLATAGAVATLAVAGPTPWLLVFLFASQANEVHYRAHHPRRGIFRALQATGWFQSPAHHGEHHRGNHDVRYCVMTNWINPLLDLVRFWKGLELAVYFATGIRPHEET